MFIRLVSPFHSTVQPAASPINLNGTNVLPLMTAGATSSVLKLPFTVACVLSMHYYYACATGSCDLPIGVIPND